MKNLVGLLGNVAGVVGVLVSAVAGIGRLAGYYHMGGFEASTLFSMGVGVMVAACLFKLHALEGR
jgi:type IV secretory pathway VirB2 component (pilin)